MSDSATTATAKRPRDNGLPSVGGSVPPPPPLDSQSQPPRKRVKVSAAELFASVQDTAGAAPTQKELAISSGGTECYAIVVGKPNPRTFEGSTFTVVNLNVILGMVDPAKNLLVDEKTNEILFDIPDPDEWAAAQAEKKRTGSKEYVEIKKRMTHRVALYQPQRLAVLNKTQLPGVDYPSVVRVIGLKCKGRRSKAYKHKKTGEMIPSRLWFDLNAEDVQPVDCLGMDATALTKYLQECGIVSDWHQEEPFGSDTQIKASYMAGKKPLAVPMVRMDDKEAIDRIYECYQDRGFTATIRPESFSSESFFYLPAPTKKKYEAEKERDSKVKIPNASDASLNNWKDFGIRASWDVIINQWDTSVHPSMNPKNSLSYETTITAYSDCLWSAGLSHPAQWAVFRYHIPFIGGVLICKEDRKGTCSMKKTIERHTIMASAGPEHANYKGIGLKQLMRSWCCGAVMDVPSYLRKYALRCSFATATVLMGSEPGDAENEKRRIFITGQCGVDLRFDKDKNPVETKLDFNPKGFVCLNALTERTNMRTFDKEKVEQYYVLTTLSPLPKRIPSTNPAVPDKLSAMPSAKRQAELVSKIGDAEVLAICTDACRTYADKTAMEERCKADGASESMQAAAEWLSLCTWGDTSYDFETAPPYLVFATLKPPEPRVVQERAKALEIAIRAWRQGPSGAITQGRAPVRINAPAKDSVDLAPAANGAAVDDADPDATLPPPLEDTMQVDYDDEDAEDGSEDEDEDEDAEMTDE